MSKVTSLIEYKVHKAMDAFLDSLTQELVEIASTPADQVTDENDLAKRLHGETDKGDPKKETSNDH